MTRRTPFLNAAAALQNVQPDLGGSNNFVTRWGEDGRRGLGIRLTELRGQLTRKVFVGAAGPRMILM
jgi:hypothetical protein